MSAETIEIPGKTNLLLSGLISAAVIFQLFIMPVILAAHPVLMAAIVILLVPVNTPFWSLIHEAIHRNFFARKQINESGGRLMSILFGASFGVLRFGHLMHHQYNRDWESEYYSGGPGHTLKAWANHYFMMLGGLYYVEFLMSFLIMLLPMSVITKIARMIFSDDQHYQAVLNSLLKPDNVKKIRIDCVAALVLYALAFIIFAQNWPVLVLLIVSRALIISLMDNSYHYGTPDDNSVAAKELEAPTFLSKFILRFNYHLTHHNNTRLPWSRLAEHHKVQGNDYAEKLFPAVLKQFKGPIRND